MAFYKTPAIYDRRLILLTRNINNFYANFYSPVSFYKKKEKKKRQKKQEENANEILYVGIFICCESISVLLFYSGIEMLIIHRVQVGKFVFIIRTKFRGVLKFILLLIL